VRRYTGGLAAAVLACAVLVLIAGFSPQSAGLAGFFLASHLINGAIAVALFAGWLARRPCGTPGGMRVIDRLARLDGEVIAAGPARHPWGEGVMWCVAVLVYSFSWLWVAVEFVGARVSPALLEADLDTAAGVAFSLSILLLAPFIEETAYRSYLFDRIRSRWGAGAAIGLTAFLWALMHTGTIDPGWVKYVQILGIGVILGIVRLRLGLEACVAIHLVLNLSGLVAVPAALIEPSM
jgi:membrane protease YdiL (CAAX protease family)